MGRVKVASAILMALILGAAGTSWGAVHATAMVTVAAPLASSAQLTISPNVINFPDANPDTVPTIAATQNPVSVTANAQTGGGRTVTLGVLAQGDLVSGGNTIAINNVTWTATGSGFRNGTMNKTTSQLAGQWTGPGSRTGTFSYSLKNSWSYATGSYTQTVIYTLIAP